MYNPDTDLLFPLRVVPQLRSLRGPEWANLIDEVLSEKAGLAEKSAFVLLMVKLSGCNTCNSDSFRAMRGCTACARQVVRRFRGSDMELLQQYRALVSEVQQFISTQFSGGVNSPSQSLGDTNG